MLITLSFVVPIAKMGLMDAKIKHRVSPSIYIKEWIASGVLASLVQFIGMEFPTVAHYQIVITCLVAAFAKEIVVFLYANRNKILQSILNIFINLINSQDSTKSKRKEND